MDAVLFRTAMSPGIREQGDCFPMIANKEGKMVVGQFGSFIGPFMEAYDDEIEEGDIILTNDPYMCNAAALRRDQHRDGLDSGGHRQRPELPRDLERVDPLVGGVGLRRVNDVRLPALGHRRVPSTSASATAVAASRNARRDHSGPRRDEGRSDKTVWSST